MAEDAAARTAALDRLLPLQREDFAGIFKAMDGFPVTVRLLDPPLHEFVPKTEGPTPRRWLPAPGCRSTGSRPRSSRCTR